MRLLLAIGLLGLAGCKTGEDERCERQEECQHGLVCIGPAWNHRCLKQRHADAFCRLYRGGILDHREACLRFGMCTAKDGKCVAASDEDCKNSATRWMTEGRKTLGACTAKDGECVAGKDEDCLPTPACQDKGLRHCTAKDGKCVK